MVDFMILMNNLHAGDILIGGLSVLVHRPDHMTTHRLMFPMWGGGGGLSVENTRTCGYTHILGKL